MTYQALGFEEVETGNQIIAEFIGLKKNDKGLYYFPAVGKEYTDVYFHSCIDWIIPVLSRIEEHGYDSVILRRKQEGSSVYSCKIRKEDNDKAEFEASVIDSNRVAAIWRAVIQFISKHGELKQHTNIKTT